MTSSKKYHLITILILYFFVLTIYLKDILFGLNVLTQALSFIAIIVITILSRLCLMKENAFSFYSLYYLTFVIFIGGSFIVYPFSESNLLCRDAFGLICLSDDIFSEAFFLIISSSIAIEAGYLVSYKPESNNEGNNSGRNNSKNIFLFTVLILILFFPLLYFSTVNSILTNYYQGYLAGFKASQGDTYATPSALVYLLFVSVGLGLLYTIRNSYPNLFRLYLFLFITNLLLSVFAGGRAGFVTALFMILWFKYRELKGSKHLVKLFSYGFIIVALVNLMMIFNGRIGDTGVSFSELFLKLIDSQGISFFVFSMSTTIDNYPFLAYFKTVLPGSVHIYNYFVESVPSYMTAFPNYLAWSIDSTLYNEGYALGWSIYSDFYLFSFGFYPVFLIFGFIWGNFLSKLNRNSDFANGLLITIMPVLLMINRATFSALVPYVILYTISYLFLTKVKVFK